MIQVFEGTGCDVEAGLPRIRWTDSPDDPHSGWVGAYGEDRIAINYWATTDSYYAYHNGSMLAVGNPTREKTIEALLKYLTGR